jgi:hypothetical protein
MTLLLSFRRWPILTAFAVLLLPGPSARAQPVAALDSSIGAVFKHGSRVCLRIRTAALASATALILVDPEAATVVGSAVVLGKAPGCGRDHRDGYVIKTARPLRGGFVLFGIIGAGNQVRIEAGIPLVALANSTGTLALHSCASADGIHLTVWKRHPLEGPRLWHDYVYLNQDLDPDCTDKETS